MVKNNNYERKFGNSYPISPPKRPKTQNLLPKFRLNNCLSPADAHCVRYVNI